MKRIVCEVCESTDIIKDGGTYICQSCGMKYSLGEIKALLREVDEEEAPVAAPAPSPSTPVANPNQQQVENLLVLATTAYEAKNNQEAETYCNRAIEIDATAYKAWNLKGKAIGWQSQIDNLRMEEAAHSFAKAIDFAPEEEKEEYKNQAYEELKKLGLAVASLRKQRFAVNPVEEELNGFLADQKVVMNALSILRSHGGAVPASDEYPEKIAAEMTDAAEAALKMTQVAWNNLKLPSDRDLSTYLNWNSNICKLLRIAVSLNEKGDKVNMRIYEVLNRALEDPFGKSSMKQQYYPFLGKYFWEKSRTISDEAVAARSAEIEENKKKIGEIEEKLAARKRARMEAYWEAHAEEKAKIDAELEKLETEKALLTAKINETDRNINAAQDASNEKTDDYEKRIAACSNDAAAAVQRVHEKTPAEIETAEIHKQIQALENKRENLGIFAGREKKQIEEQLTSLRGRLGNLKVRAEEEKDQLKEEIGAVVSKAKETKQRLEAEQKTVLAEIKQRADALQEEKKELAEKLSGVESRISRLQEDLQKDPEE